MTQPADKSFEERHLELMEKIAASLAFIGAKVTEMSERQKTKRKT